MIFILLPAQEPNNYLIQGIVSDSLNGETLIGVNVYLKSSGEGTVTDNSGYYSIYIPGNKQVLVFSYIGYTSKEVHIQTDKDIELDIKLQTKLTQLDEVHIIAQRKFFGNMDYGREIPSINAEVIARQNVNNASDILHARLAGVWATNTSGAPGDQQKIRIRGQSSFFSSSEPLYVVDGVPVPIVNLSSLGIADLNIHDIENVTVLKNASSASLYGYQGGNGVVLIDTKKGGRKEISFSTKIGYQWFNNFYNLMSSEEQLTSFDLAYSKMNLRMLLYYPEMSDTLCNRDWQKYIFRTGFTTEYQLSASGSLHKIRYYISGNYLKQSGIMPNSKYERLTGSVKLSRQFFKKFVLEVGYRASKQINENNQNIYQGNRVVFEGISKSPCMECTPDSLIENDNGLTNRIYYDYTQLKLPYLPSSIISQNNHSIDINNQSFNLSAKYQINDYFSINALGSFLYRHSNYDMKYKYIYYTSFGSLPYDILLNSREEVILINHQYNISYFRTFKQHEVGIVAAYRFYEDNLWWRVDTLEGTLNSYSYLRNSMASYGVDGSVLRLMNSYLCNASYNYHKRYFLSVVANVSRIKEGLHIDYYTFFPSLAISWDIAQENLLQKIKWLNRFSLYVNWGKSGNYPLNSLANDLYRKVKTTYGTTTDTYPAIFQFANHYLKHENTTETSYGVIIGLFDERIRLSTELYSKKINNLIMQRDIPHYYAGGNHYINIGKVSATGSEFGVEANPVKRKNFSWFLNFNLSFSRQIVDRLSEDGTLTFHDNDILIPTFIIKEGEELGDIYGYKCLGKWTPADENYENNLFIESGGMKYLNADTANAVLDANDMVVIGNSVPDFIWNFINTFHYKDFSLDIQWYAVLGVNKFNSTRAGTIMTGTNRNVNAYIADSLSAIHTDIFYQSSEFVDNAAFIRLKTVTFGYEPSKTIFKNAKLSLSLSFENLLTFTKYKGYDPEATIFTNNNFSDNAIDRGAVPNPKAVYMTVGLKF